MDVILTIRLTCSGVSGDCWTRSLVVDAAGGGGVEGRSAILGKRNDVQSSADIFWSGY